MLRNLAIVAVCGLAASTTHAADQTSAFSYQGLIEFNGQPFTGQLEVSATLFDAEVGGNQASAALIYDVAPGNFDAIDVVNGLFTFAPEFAVTVPPFDGRELWLDLQIRDANAGQPFTILSRQLIRSAPYATSIRGMHAYAAGPELWNLVGGAASNDAGTGGLGNTISGGGSPGSPNVITATQYGTISGGKGNTVGGNSSTVGGGAENLASGFRSTVSGGELNEALASSSTISGGNSNVIPAGGTGSTIGGGQINQAQNDYATVGGGSSNFAQGERSTVAGGSFNIASGQYSIVAGGILNRAENASSTVNGGDNNTASGASSTISGGTRNTAAGMFASVGGGNLNAADAAMSTIAGGASNVNNGTAGAIGGGEMNTTGPGIYPVIAGGRSNSSIAAYSTVGGGQGNAAEADWATSAGGRNNRTLARYATVSGGQNNTADGLHATVPGGNMNIATGDASFAAGSEAQALHPGAFVWADTSGAPFASTDKSQFLIRASNGVSVNTTPVAGAALTVAGSAVNSTGAWGVISDARLKHDVEPLTGSLDRLTALEPVTFEYNADAPIPAEGRRAGFVAQQVETVFPEWIDETAGYKTLQMTGFQAHAVEAMKELKAENDSLRSELAELRRIVEALADQAE